MVDLLPNRVAVVLAKGVNGLGVVRSLNTAGYVTVVVSPSFDDLAMYSRLPAAKHVVPLSDQWQADLLQLLTSLTFPTKPSIVACSDLTASFLAEHRDVLAERFEVLVPSLSVMKALNDKRLELELMQQCGIPIPTSVTRLESLKPGTEFETLPFPMLIKPRVLAGMELIGRKNVLVRDAAALHEFCEHYRQHLDEFVMQEVVSGGDASLWLCSAAFDRNSTLLAAFTFQRLGAMPFHYGVTSIGESRPNSRVVALVAEVGKKLGCVGPTDLEFMYDARRDIFVYIEVNPRIGMNNWFDTSSGVNVIGAACDSALGLPPRIYRQEAGVIFVNSLGDLIARLEVRQSLLQILRVYWRLRGRRKSWAIYRRGDALPALVNLLGEFRRLVRRAARLLLTKLGLRRR